MHPETIDRNKANVQMITAIRGLKRNFIINFIESARGQLFAVYLNVVQR